MQTLSVSNFLIHGYPTPQAYSNINCHGRPYEIFELNWTHQKYLNIKNFVSWVAITEIRSLSCKFAIAIRKWDSSRTSNLPNMWSCQGRVRTRFSFLLSKSPMSFYMGKWNDKIAVSGRKSINDKIEALEKEKTLIQWKKSYCQPAFNCSKLTIKTLKQGVKFVQSQQYRHQNDIS